MQKAIFGRRQKEDEKKSEWKVEETARVAGEICGRMPWFLAALAKIPPPQAIEESTTEWRYLFKSIVQSNFKRENKSVFRWDLNPNRTLALPVNGHISRNPIRSLLSWECVTHQTTLLLLLRWDTLRKFLCLSEKYHGLFLFSLFYYCSVH